MQWIKDNIVSLLISGYLVLGSLYFNDKLNEVKETRQENKDGINAINNKLDELKDQRFNRYEDLLNDYDKRLIRLETKSEMK